MALVPRACRGRQALPRAIYWNLKEPPGVQSIDPEFAQFPVTSSHWRITPFVTHDVPPFGVPGALVTKRPPLIVRLIRVCWFVMNN